MSLVVKYTARLLMILGVMSLFTLNSISVLVTLALLLLASMTANVCLETVL